MENEAKKKFSWLRSFESIGAAALSVLSFAPEIIDALTSTGVLKEYTLVAKLGLPLAAILKIFNVKKQYQKDNLPSGLTKIMDKIPDNYTGTKGELK
jgi:hypothetical protein